MISNTLATYYIEPPEISDINAFHQNLKTFESTKDLIVMEY